MGMKHLVLGFAGVFLAAVVFLVWATRNFLVDGVEGGAVTVMWAALIVVVLLFGVVIISLFVNRIRRNSGGKHSR